MKRGTPLVLLADLDAGERGVFVPFFGVPASTVRTPAWCVKNLNATVMPFVVLRTGDDSYRATIYPALTGLGAGIVEDTCAINQVIEAFVSEVPNQYWWENQRFATPPPGCQPVYQSA
jgi:KDO2-lipid IV(A) lauroyltransferase